MPHAGQPLGAVIGHHVDVAVDDVGVRKPGRDSGEHVGIVEGIVGIEETDGVAGQFVQPVLALPG